MENCHPYDNDGYLGPNTTITDQSSWIVCNYPNGTDICAVVALCAAERIGYALAIPTIACVGILLNVFNLIVLSTNRFPESSYSYLAALAVADLLSLCFFAVNGIGRGCYPDSYAWRTFEVYVYFPLGHSTTTASILLTVTVTVERYAFIYHPMQSKTWCSQMVARRVVAVVAAVSFAINIPRFFVMTVDANGHLEFTDFSRSQFYVYLSWVYFSLISLAPSLSLIVFNTLLIIGIRRTGRKRKSLFGTRNGNSRSQEEATLTRTLIIVVCVFIAGELPSSFTSRSLVVALISGGDQSILTRTGYRIAVLVSTILVVMQHSLNFVVYCVFNRRFCSVLRLHYLPILFGYRSKLNQVVDEVKALEGNSENKSSLRAANTFV